jgi:hypothetical protein
MKKEDMTVICFRVKSKVDENNNPLLCSVVEFNCDIVTAKTIRFESLIFPVGKQVELITIIIGHTVVCEIPGAFLEMVSSRTFMLASSQCDADDSRTIQCCIIESLLPSLFFSQDIKGLEPQMKRVRVQFSEPVDPSLLELRMTEQQPCFNDASNNPLVTIMRKTVKTDMTPQCAAVHGLFFQLDAQPKLIKVILDEKETISMSNEYIEQHGQVFLNKPDKYWFYVPFPALSPNDEQKCENNYTSWNLSNARCMYDYATVSCLVDDKPATNMFMLSTDFIFVKDGDKLLGSICKKSRRLQMCGIDY